MFSRAFLGLMSVAFFASAGYCETYGEKLSAVDSSKRTITFTSDGKERTLKVDEKAEIQTQVRAGKRLRITPLKDGLKGLKKGVEVTISTEKKEGVEVVTRLVVLSPEPKK